MTALRLSQIWHYPVKSMRGIRCKTLRIDARGPVYDRHWMLVDQQGRFITQRQFPHMALIKVALDGHQLTFGTAHDSYTVTPTEQPDNMSVTVWHDQCQAWRIDPQADEWLSQQLGHACHLVEMPPDVVGQDAVRQVDQQYAKPDDQVGFADGFPFLLISQAGLEHLNERLDSPIDMRRFRPNLVVTGCAPHAEDTWREIRIGDIDFRVAKPCSRCIIPSIHPDTGERAKEPLKTLLTYRQRDNKIYFGQNLLHDAPGYLTEGAAIEVVV